MKMCDNVRISSQTSTSSKYSNDGDLYAIWLKNLETSDQERKFKVRSKYPVDASLELISGNLLLSYTDSAPSTPTSSRTPSPVTTPKKIDIQDVVTPGAFETPEQADIAILDTPSKNKRAQLRKNLSKLLQKFQRNNARMQDESFGPTYHKYQYNCSLYEHFDKLNTSSSSQLYTCIEAN